MNPHETDSGSSKYQMPIKSPNVSSWYGSRWGTVHKDIDFSAAKGTPIMASKSGTVEFAGFGVRGQGFGGYGNAVVIRHEERTLDIIRSYGLNFNYCRGTCTTRSSNRKSR